MIHSCPTQAARPRRVCASIFALGLIALAPSGPAQPPPPGLPKLVAERSEALVTVQSVCQVESSGALGALFASGEEFASEATCMMIDAKGIVLCSHAQLIGLASLAQRFLGPAARGVKLTVTPSRLTVFLNGGAERFEARLVAKDTELDLAWLAIVNPSGKTFASFDLARRAEARIGDRLLVLQRLEEYFDRSVVTFDGQIGGITRLPRQLYVPTVQLEANFGLPVVTPNGELIGVTVLQMAREDDAPESSGTFGSIRQATRLRSLSRAFILPASAVASATVRALAPTLRPATPGKR